MSIVLAKESCLGLNRVVGTIAERHIFAVAAETDEVCGLSWDEHDGTKWTSIVRSIAERLNFGKSTGTVPIGSSDF